MMLLLILMMAMLMTMVTMLVFSGEPRVLPFARLRVGRGSSLEGEDALGCLTSESLHLVQGWFDFPQMADENNCCDFQKQVHLIIDELARALEDDTSQNDNNNVRSFYHRYNQQNNIIQGVSPLPVLKGDACVGERLKEDDYLVWVDADAVFIDHKATLEEVVLKGKEREVIIGEDMHVGNLVNCGIILIKMSLWSLQLWRQVFQCRR